MIEKGPLPQELQGMVETVGLDRHVSKLKEWYPLRADHFSMYKLYLGLKTKKQIYP